MLVSKIREGGGDEGRRQTLKGSGRVFFKNFNRVGRIENEGKREKCKVTARNLAAQGDRADPPCRAQCSSNLLNASEWPQSERATTCRQSEARNVSHRAAARESLPLACFRSTYCGWVKARSRSGRRYTVTETKMTGETERV